VTRCFFLAILLAAALGAADSAHLGKSLAEWRGDLASADRTTRLLAARSLGEMGIAGAEGALPALTSALNHDDSAVRYWAAVALGEMGSRAGSAKTQLQEALRDDVPEVRVWAAYALARQGDAAAGVPVLIEVLDGEERGARLQAITALDQLGETARPAAAQMKKAVSDDFDYVGRIARHALWALGERPCPYRDCD
jgi:HEAT repeat protein